MPNPPASRWSCARTSFRANAEDVAGLLPQVEEQSHRYGDIRCPSR